MRTDLHLGLLFVALAPVLYWNDRKSAILTGVAGVLSVLAILALSAPFNALVSALAMAALFALAWVKPKGLIWVTLLYPFAAIWLLWGGQVWVPISAIFAVVLGIAAGLLYGRIRMPVLNLLYAIFAALGAAVIAASVIHYGNNVSADFLGKMSGADFYPGFGADSGPLAKVLGAVISAAIWIISMVVWVLVGVLRWVSYVLNLNLSMIAVSALPACSAWAPFWPPSAPSRPRAAGLPGSASSSASSASAPTGCWPTPG